LSEGCEPLISKQDAPSRYRVGCAAGRSALPRERFSPLAHSVVSLRCGIWSATGAQRTPARAASPADLWVHGLAQFGGYTDLFFLLSKGGPA